MLYRIGNMNKLRPEISLVVPVRNGMPFLSHTLNSILNLQYLPNELIISDNCSTDGSSIMIRKFAEIYKGNLKILTTPKFVNGGESWNFAVENSSCNWVLMLHSDDLIRESALAIFRKSIEKIEPDINLIAGRCEIINNHGKLIIGKFGIGKSVLSGGKEFLLHNLTRPSFNTGSICFKKSAWVAAGKFDTIHSHWCDLLFYHRLALKGKILIIPKVTARYRVYDYVRDADDRVNIENSNLEWFNSTYLPKLLEEIPEINNIRNDSNLNIYRVIRSFSLRCMRKLLLFFLTILRRFQDFVELSGFRKNTSFVYLESRIDE